MFSWFLPRDTSFFDFFDQQAAHIVEAARELYAQTSKDSISFEETRRIRQIEHQADDLTHRCVEALHQTFITPIERDDILHLISTMDDIIDGIDGVANCLIIYKIDRPTKELTNLAAVLLDASYEIENAVKKMRDSKHANEIRQHCISINRLENKADTLFFDAIGNLFENESDLRRLIKLKEIYELLEDSTDKCEDVSNIIEGIILECSWS